VYVLYVLATMYVYVYVSTWVYGLLDFEKNKLFKQNYINNETKQVTKANR